MHCEKLKFFRYSFQILITLEFFSTDFSKKKRKKERKKAQMWNVMKIYQLGAYLFQNRKADVTQLIR